MSQPYPADQLFVEFVNATPDTIDVRPVDGIDMAGIEVPDDAIMFRYFRRASGPVVIGGDPEQAASPRYYLSLDPKIGPIETMCNDYAGSGSSLAARWRSLGIDMAGLVTYAGNLSHYILIPLTPDYVLLDRETRKLIWQSVPQRENAPAIARP